MIVNPRRRIKSQGSKENQFSVLISNGRKHPEGKKKSVVCKAGDVADRPRKKLSAHKLLKTITPGRVPVVLKK